MQLNRSVLPPAVSSDQEAFDRWRSLERLRHEDLYRGRRGLDATFASWASGLRARRVNPRRVVAHGEEILSKSRRMASICDADLREQLRLHRDRFSRFETRKGTDAAIAAIAAVVPRVLGFELHPVQLAAVAVLAEGKLVEFATGEGKTVTAAVAGVLAAWEGLGCHVVTVNDYLAQRDAENLAAFFDFCDLNVEWISGQSSEADRRRAYRADITYATHKELCADFVRDQLKLRNNNSVAGAISAQLCGTATSADPALVMRGLASVIVDEADSVLVDDAVTPLLISGEGAGEDDEVLWEWANRTAAGLAKMEDYCVDLAAQTIALTERGRDRIEALHQETTGAGGFREALHAVRQSLVARIFYHREERYIIHDGEVAIVDESTGRLMADRTWRDGLHQAVEAKEGLPITPQGQTEAKLSFQDFFGRYPRLSGMTGTAWEARDELARIYSVEVTRIPTHRPVKRDDLGVRIFPTADEKWEAVAREALRVRTLSRPVLIGTRSIQASLRVSEELTKMGLDHEVLNAHRDREEAEIVAHAGQSGRVTVATNMAGRGTDIALDSNSRDAGGLHVIATELHVSARIDRQLFGRAARQGDPGSSVAITSCDDEIFVSHLRPLEQALLRRTALEGSPKWTRLVEILVARAQGRSEKRLKRARLGMLEAERRSNELLGFSANQ